MWPTYTAAGNWETVRQKYLRNPHVRLCPGSGLYGYFQGNKICGIMGAYPMPVTLNGVVYPGHMSVDWAVLPLFQRQGITRKLYEVVVSLPGRKFASIGSRASQEAMERRGFRISAVNALAVILPLKAALLRLLHLTWYAQPSPLCGEPISLPGIATSITPEEFRSAMPPDSQGTAFVYRGPDFWQVYCEHRLQNGGFPIRLFAKDGEGDVLIKLLEVGPLRVCIVLAVYLQPSTIQCAQQLGRSFRSVLKNLKVCALMTTEPDELWAVFLKAASVWVSRSPTYWWIIPCASDSFSADEVRWWLTWADRDSHWGYVQPSLTFRGAMDQSKRRSE